MPRRCRARGASSAYLTDLSVDGARVTCDAEPPALEEWVTVEVRLPRQAERSSLPGRVKWVQPAENRKGHTFGITFEGMSAEDQGRRRDGAGRVPAPGRGAVLSAMRTR